ncbi:uncharacterized protein EV154DRAFT_522725 [Mucor mucedo]|uniref:uncharacterized protein n=1 Tax=Mucor mucedo TaxID=29922 RepID=UPI002220E59F|nr:uncharacterized protein EV154DRAFT_522725 [Mucor mucedo]KAI7883395.1 hypothetical protein EV154DRAFT_522725 [Mucor mucedo]
MRKSTTHLKDVSRFLSTPVDSGKSSVIPTTCRRNSHLSALLNAFPLEKQQQRLIPNNRRSTLIRTMSTSTATIENLPIALPPVTASFKRNVITPTPTTTAASRLQGSLSLFNLSDTVVLADLDHAIQIRNADKAWSLFITLASKQDDTIPFNMCCSLYSLLDFCKRLAGGAKQATKLRQRQLDQLLDYVQQNNSSLLFLSSIQEIPISSHKQLLRAIRVEDQREAWHLFYRLHKASVTIDKLPRNTCIKLMVFMMKDRTLDKNQLKSRLQLIALHGAGTSEFDSRYMSAADVLRIANICHGYEKSETFAHNLIDEFVVGIFKKKQSIRADALDELIWRILVNQDISKAHQVLDTVQAKYADKVDVNEMVFVNLMNAYRRQKNYHESLKLFEKLLEEKNTRPTIKSFNAVLQIFAVQGSADRASYIFETMNHLGVIPDISSYTELIRANAHNLKTCIYYYNKMRQNELKPNVYTYSALIEASSRRNDIKSVLEWFQTMLDENVQPNQVVISCILKSLSKQHSEYPNMPEAVIQIAHQAAMAGIKTDAALYTILLKMQAESIGIEGALKIHRDMLAQSVEPNAYTYTILINACGKFRMPETAEKIFDLMKNSARHQPNTVTYTVLMDAWSIADRRDKVEGLISEFLKECKSDKSGRLWLDTRIRERLKSSCC